jgi:hypothetical protein
MPYLSMVWCAWRKLPYMSCWPADQWKFCQSTSCLPGLWSTWTCLPASAAVTPYWWQGISVPNTWTGILGRPQGAASYVITPVKIPVWFTGRIPLPLFCRTVSPPNVLDIVVTKDQSPQCIGSHSCTEFRSLTSNDWHTVLIILSQPTVFLWFQKDQLGLIPGLPGGWTSIQPRPAARGGNRHCLGTFQCCFEG